MALVVTNQGEGIVLEYIVNRDAPENLVLRLYSNDVTPAETDTAVTYTEVTGGGYASKTLTGASWNAPTTGDPSYIDYAIQTWTFTGAVGNVYGYYLTRSTGGELVYAERFTAAPYNIQNNGDKINVTPRIEAS